MLQGKASVSNKREEEKEELRKEERELSITLD